MEKRILGELFLITKCKEKKKFTEWSAQEDEILLQMTENDSRKNWKKISECIKTKTIERCRYRYFQINPHIKHGNWTKEEDEVLHRLVKKHGLCWQKISKFMKKRNAKQIRSRYVNYIFEGINKSKFSECEDQIILENYKSFKSNWIKYCSLIPNRSPRQIENRAKVVLQKQFKNFLNNIVS